MDLLSSNLGVERLHDLTVGVFGALEPFLILEGSILRRQAEFSQVDRFGVGRLGISGIVNADLGISSVYCLGSLPSGGESLPGWGWEASGRFCS